MFARPYSFALYSLFVLVIAGNVSQNVMGQQPDAVPAVVGLTAKDAKQLVESVGMKVRFQLGRTATVADQSLRVYEQIPAGGTPAVKGGEVKLTIFAQLKQQTEPGTEMGTVPQLAGLSARDAKVALQKARLEVDFTIGRLPPSSEEQLTAYAQHPPAGAKSAAGTKVAVELYAKWDSGIATVPTRDDLTQVVARPFLDEITETVDPRSGYLVAQVTDVRMRAGPIMLEVSRSKRVRPGDPGLLGKHWRFNWEKYLKRRSDYAVIEEGATEVLFKLEEGPDEYRSDLGETLEFSEDGALRTLADGTTEQYDSDDRLSERTDASGNRLGFTYDHSGRLSEIVGPFGASVTFEKNSFGQVRQLTSSAGAVIRYLYGGVEIPEADRGQGLALGYAYDINGRLLSTTHPRTARNAFTYGPKGRVFGRQWSDGTKEKFSYSEMRFTQYHKDPAGRVTTVEWRPDGRQSTICDPLGNQTVVDYDELGRTVRTEGPTGEVATVNYDQQNRVTSIDNSNQGTTALQYSGASNRPVSATLPSGEQLAVEYDSKNRVVQIGFAEIDGTAVEYHDNGLPRQVRDENGQEWTFAYDERGLLSRMTDAAGNVTYMKLDSHGRLLRRTDPLGHATEYEYDAHGNLTQQTDPNGAVTRFEYSPVGLLTSQTDSNGAVTKMDYDARGRLVAVTDPVGRVTRLSYHPDGRLKSRQDAAGNATQYEYNAAGQIVRQVNPLGGVTGAVYDSQGRLEELVDPAKSSTRFEYSAKGRLTRSFDPSGAELRFEYDSKGRVRSLASGGSKVDVEYTKRGDVAKVARNDSETQTLEHDDFGRVVARKIGERIVVQYEYDKLGRMTKESYATGHEIVYEYDAVGNLISWKDNLGAGETIRYDAVRRPVEIADAMGATVRYKYDKAGNLSEVVDPFGRTKRMSYNAAGELIELVEPAGSKARYEYDAAGNLTKVHHPGGGQTAFEFDPLRNQTTSTEPLGKGARAAYDKAGRLLHTTDAKEQKTAYEYDAAGHVIAEKLADGTEVTYRYDQRGNLLEVDDGAFPVRYGYDDLGRRVEIEYPSIKRTLKYTYDDAGRTATFTDADGEKVTYDYDEHDRIRAIQSANGQSVKITYTPDSLPATIEYPNGVVAHREYDQLRRLSAISSMNAAGETLSGWEYEYDDAGNLVEKTDADGLVTRYKYDAAGQLTEEATDGKPPVTYSYLAGGNRATRQSGDEKTEYKYDEADRLVQAGQASFKYDANGNLVEKQAPDGVTRYEYDPQDQLRKVTMADGKEVAFGYGPTGDRIWREDAGGRTYFVTDGLHVVAELNAELETQATYLHGLEIDQPLVMSRSGKRYCYHSDHLGSVEQMTDESGGVAARYEYDAFGQVTSPPGSLDSRFAYTGREFDRQTGLYYYRSRYYDAELGRFLTADVLRGTQDAPLSLNRYAYVTNAPTRLVDPMGTAGKTPNLTKTIRSDVLRTLETSARLLAPLDSIGTMSNTAQFTKSVRKKLLPLAATEAALRSDTIGEGALEATKVVGGSIAGSLATTAIFGSNPAGWAAVGAWLTATAVSGVATQAIDEAFKPGGVDLTAPFYTTDYSAYGPKREYHPAMSRPLGPNLGIAPPPVRKTIQGDTISREPFPSWWASKEPEEPEGSGTTLAPQIAQALGPHDLDGFGATDEEKERIRKVVEQWLDSNAVNADARLTAAEERQLADDMRRQAARQRQWEADNNWDYGEGGGGNYGGDMGGLDWNDWDMGDGDWSGMGFF